MKGHLFCTVGFDVRWRDGELQRHEEGNYAAFFMSPLLVNRYREVVNLRIFTIGVGVLTVALVVG